MALSRLLIATRRVPEAEQHLKAAAEISTDPRAQLTLADFYFLSGKFPESAAVLTPLKESKDANVQTQVTLRLAMLAVRQGRRPEAEQLIDALVAEQPRNARALVAQAELRLANRQLAGALESISAAEAIGNTGRIQFVKGEILAALNRTDEAIAALTESAQLDTASGDPQLLLARMYLARGDAANAARFALEAKTRQPRNPVARLTLARALIAGRDFDAAQRELDELEKGKVGGVSVLTTRAALELGRKTTGASAACTRDGAGGSTGQPRGAVAADHTRPAAGSRR